MTTVSLDTRSLRRYLLGEAEEGEAEAIEREYLARQEAVDLVAAAEEELIDDYLSERLSPGDRARFERHYLASPVHVRRVAIARALNARRWPIRKRTRFLPVAAVAATLLIGLLVTLRYVQRLAGDGASIQPGSSVVSITLPVVATRDEGETATIHLGDGSRPIELRLETGELETPPPFSCIVRTVDGNVAWRGPVLAQGDASRPLLVAAIPAGVLKPDDYVVVLLGGAAGDQEQHRYYFRAVTP